MKLTPEQQLEARLALLEKQFLDLAARVNKLEYASMTYKGPGFTPGTLPNVWPTPLPVTCQDQPQMGYAQ